MFIAVAYTVEFHHSGGRTNIPLQQCESAICILLLRNTSFWLNSLISWFTFS
uniref:Uncharacterized protein n=1 Tax=Anguilla anguilla TaxID=7936 RepID=A0A0E9PHN0_ANGAN